MKDKTNKIEKIKNGLIVVLFISAILLLSFFWQDFSLSDLGSFNIVNNFVNNDEDLYQPELSDLVLPDRVSVYYGSDAYAVISPSCILSADADAEGAENITVYQKLLEFMEIYLSESDITAEKITKIQYDEVMSYASLSAEFDYDIPFTEFLAQNKITTPTGSETVANIKSFGFSTVSSENLFVYDGSANAYYRFVTANKDTADRMAESTKELVSSIEKLGTATYYTIQSLAGIDNQTLIPVYMESGLRAWKCNTEFSISNQNEVKKLEQMFFPSGLDFVRKITENKGSLLYMYGYSQKVLMLNENGSVDYTEELDSSLYSDAAFYDAFKTAVDYITAHGGWADLYTNGMVPFLSDVDKITKSDGRYNGYRFEIGFKINGKPVKYSSDSIVSVEVYGSQVTSYMRDAVIPAENTDEAGEKVVAKDAIDVITDNYIEVCRIISESTNEENELKKITTAENKFEELTKRITNIRLCYLRDTQKNPGSIVPAWYIEIGSSKFWCDTQTGEILDYDVGEVE